MATTFDTRAEALADYRSTRWLAASRGYEAHPIELPQIHTLRCEHYDNDLSVVVSWIELAGGRWERSVTVLQWDDQLVRVETLHPAPGTALVDLLVADLTADMVTRQEAAA